MPELFDTKEIISLRSSIESDRRVVRRALTDMQAAASKAQDNLNRKNVIAVQADMAAVVDLSQLLAQAVQDILSALDELEELYSLQMKRT